MNIKKSFEMIFLLILLSSIVTGLAYAFVYESATQQVTQQILKRWLCGYNSTGSTNYPNNSQTIGDTSSNAAASTGYAKVWRFTASATGTVTKIGLNVRTSVGNLQVCIYTDSSGTPGTLLGNSASTASVAGWNDLSLSAPVFVTAGTSYWMGYQNSNSALYVYRGTIAGNQKYVTNAYGSFPNLFGTPTGSNTNNINMRITYVCIEGYAKAMKVTLSTTAVVKSVSFYAHATGNFRFALYSDGSGPASLLWQSSSTAASAVAWNTVNVTSGIPSNLSLTAGTYWLVWQWDTPNSGPSYTFGISGDGNYIVQAYGSFPSSWASGISTSEKWSVYFNYTTQ